MFNSLSTFYSGIDSTLDERLSPRLGAQVIEWCHRFGKVEPLTESPIQKATKTLSTDHNGTNTKPKVLILGGSGFIGQEFVKVLVSKGTAVRVLCRSPKALPSFFINPLIDIVQGDMNAPESLANALNGIETVVHLAKAGVSSWKDYYEQEVLVTKNIAEICLEHGISRLIFTGTLASYYSGSTSEVITESTPLPSDIQRFNNYAKAKAMSETVLNDYFKSRNLPVVIIRPGIVIGGNGNPFHWGVGMWNWNDNCQLWGNGKNPLPFVLVEDVAEALALAITVPGIEGETFNLAADVPVSGRDYIGAMEGCSGLKFTVRPTPMWRFFATDVAKWIVKCAVRHPEHSRPSYRDWASRSYKAKYNCQKAKTTLGWKPEESPSKILSLGVEKPMTAWMNGGDRDA